MSLQVLSLCSGIGGFELAAEMVNHQLGFEAFQLKALCEKNKFCRDRALRPNFPNIPIYEDIRDITTQLGDYDLIVGGLPCQPFSQAGKQKGEADDRNLFPEFFRILRGVRPRGAIIENVPGLLTIDSGRIFAGILWEFTKAGYSVEWNIVSCAELGGVHRRERLWIVAHSHSIGRDTSDQRTKITGSDDSQGWAECVESTGTGRVRFASEQLSKMETSSENGEFNCLFQNANRVASDSNSIGHSGSKTGESSRNEERNNSPRESTGTAELYETVSSGATTPDSDQSRFQQRKGCPEPSGGSKLDWHFTSNAREQEAEAQPGLCRRNDGLPSRMVRSHLMTPDELPEWLPYATDDEDKPFRKEMLQALGNAIVPDVAAIAFMRFLELIDMKTEFYMEQESA